MYGNIIRRWKKELGLTYDKMLDQMFKYYPGETPTRQTIEGWAAERHYPDMITLAIISHNAPKGSWISDLVIELNQEVYSDKIRKRLASYQKEK